MPSQSKKRAKKGQDTVERVSALATRLENDLSEKVASHEPGALYKSVIDRCKTKRLEASQIPKKLPQFLRDQGVDRISLHNLKEFLVHLKQDT